MEEIIATQALDADMKVFSHLVYEYEKGVRNLVLYTLSEEYMPLALGKLDHREIEYFVQPVPNKSCVNIFFGRSECLKTLKKFLRERPLNSLSPEEDFILGALLGYDLCRQCERYCKRVEHAESVRNASEQTVTMYVSL